MSQAARVCATAINSTALQLQNAATNLANQGTPGYYATQAVPVCLSYQSIAQGAIGTTTTGEPAVPPLQFGTGVRIGSVLPNLRTGLPEATQNKFDVFIDGPGYIKVDRGNGQFGYTRAGHLKLDEDGILRTATDYIVDGNITIDMSQFADIIIDRSGRVLGVDPSQEGQGQYQELGRIMLTRFTNPAGLQPLADTIYLHTPEAGAEVSGIAGQNNFGVFRQGYVQRANVEGPTELVRAVEVNRAGNSAAALLRIAEKHENEALQQITTSV